MSTIERRFINAAVRSVGQTMSIEGIAVNYASLSPKGNLPGFREQIAPGAFAVGNAPVSLLVDHDSSKVLGKTTAGNLQLNDSDRCLSFRCTPPDTSYARDLIQNVRAGLQNECSFGFICDDEDWDKDPDDRNSAIRTIKRARLLEISCVQFPVYDRTSVNSGPAENDGANFTRDNANLQASRCFPQGMAELRGKLQARGIVIPDFDYEAWKESAAQRLVKQLNTL